jgi:IPT/TIG domain/Metallo-peptidase family M12
LRHSLGFVGVAALATLLAPNWVVASQTLKASPSGRLVDAADDKSRIELLSFDTALAPGLVAVPLEGSVRIEDWPVAPGARRTVVVAHHDIYAPDAKIVAIDGGREVEVPRSRQVFFWGSIEDEPGSTVMIALDPEQRTLSGFVTSMDGSFDLLPPSPDRPASHAIGAASAFRPAGPGGGTFTCGQGDLPARGLDRALANDATHLGAEPQLISSLHTAVLAVDTDNEAMAIKFANANPSTSIALATNWIAQAIAGMSAVYERDLYIRFYQGYTILRLPATPDPYVQNAGGGADGAKLDEFSTYWSTNYGGIKRTVTMMISGKEPALPPGQGMSFSGIAWVPGLCSLAHGYSFNQVFRTGTSAGSYDVQLLGHEVGHNFGSQHTHCTDTSAAAGTQPIDNCYPICAPGQTTGCDTCFGAPAWSPNVSPTCPAAFSITPANNGGVALDGVRGTLMSYCHLGACADPPPNPVTNVFHPLTVNVIAPRIDAAISGANACIFPLTVNPAPSVTSINPASGPLAGGTAVTITGINFRAPASVAFADLAAGKAATSVVVVNPTTITAVTPAHTAGLKGVVVMNPDQRTSTLTNGFTYSSGPTVSAISPNIGPVAGGTAVTITGSGFVAPATVTLGGTAATAVNVVNTTTITATTPAHATGTVSVVVQTNAQTATLASSYFYFTPPAPGKFYTLSPCRLVDTRNAPGGLGGPVLAASARRDFTLANVCGIPPTAKALSVNLTVTGAAAPGFVALFPGNGLPPLTSNINFGAGQTRANNAVVLLATDGNGTLAVRNGAAGTVHFILDVNGYFQ